MDHLCIFVPIFKTHSKMINLRDIKFLHKTANVFKITARSDEFSFVFTGLFESQNVMVARVQNKSPSADFGDSAFVSIFNRI